jgi:hypothetical protein
VFIVIYCFYASNYHAAANFLIGGHESFKNGRVFGKCGRECLSRPGNTAEITNGFSACACLAKNSDEGCQPALYKAGFQKTGLFEKNLASENFRPCDRP